MIEVEGNINNQPIAIFIDYRDRHRYIYPNVVDRFKFKRCKHENSCLVQLATRTNRIINELTKDFAVNMNEINTKEDLKIIPLELYDCLIAWSGWKSIMLSYISTTRLSHVMMMKEIQGQFKLFQGIYLSERCQHCSRK
jgi:hypothetical protein